MGTTAEKELGTIGGGLWVPLQRRGVGNIGGSLWEPWQRRCLVPRAAEPRGLYKFAEEGLSPPYVMAL